MFGNKRRRHLALEIRAADGRVLFEDRLQRLTLPEAVVLALSEEFFGDPQPCEIHRAAVLSRAMAELEVALAIGTPYRVENLSGRVRASLSAYPQASTVRLYEEVRA